MGESCASQEQQAKNKKKPAKAREAAVEVDIHTAKAREEDVEEAVANDATEDEEKSSQECQIRLQYM